MSKKVVKSHRKRSPYEKLREKQMRELKRIKGKGYMPGGKK